MQVYSVAISTVVLSFCLDEDNFKGGKYKAKVNSRGEPDPRMFAQINGKIRLAHLLGRTAQNRRTVSRL